jgi:hypothetical protein
MDDLLHFQRGSGEALGKHAYRPTFACEHERRMVDQNSASWNQVVLWMQQLESLSRVS